MDIEKTIEFIRNKQAVNVAAVASLQGLIGPLASKAKRFDGVMASPASSHAKLIERMDAIAQLTDAMHQQWMEDGRALDARIDELIRDIHEFIRNKPANG